MVSALRCAPFLGVVIHLRLLPGSAFDKGVQLGFYLLSACHDVQLSLPSIRRSEFTEFGEKVVKIFHAACLTTCFIPICSMSASSSSRIFDRSEFRLSLWP